VIGSAPERPTTLVKRWEAWLETLHGTPLGHYALAAWIVLLSILASAILERLLPLPVPNLSLMFLTSVLIVAARTSLGPALAAAGMSFLAYNFFFTEPRLTFIIHDPGQLVKCVFLSGDGHHWG
jgi:two-component system sensor histidine kinase KdpD